MFSRVFWKEFPWKFFPEKNGNFWNFHFFPEMEIFGNGNFWKKWKFLEMEIFGKNGNFWNFHFFPEMEIFGISIFWNFHFLEFPFFGISIFWNFHFLEMEIFGNGNFPKWKNLEMEIFGKNGKNLEGVVLTPGRYWKPIPTIPIGLVGKVGFGVFLTLVKIYIFRNKSLVHLHKNF